MDYGAGRLRNSKYLLSQGFDVSIIDTPLQLSSICVEDKALFTNVFEVGAGIENKFDVILCSYVLNVIPDINERIKLVTTIEQLINEDGIVVIEVRGEQSLKDVKYKLEYNDGYVCGNTSVRTFQKPYKKIQIIDFIEANTSLKILETKSTKDNILIICKK